ncbi:hypothetical protein SDC9_169634 [bioreactor metagenome]|uniref:Uncharacterized protein n=1 Tax=bioreactor metagenome TaxID=1076179 RepID=A0A645G5U7_9ZZZZ
MHCFLMDLATISAQFYLYLKQAVGLVILQANGDKQVQFAHPQLMPYIYFVL